MIRTEGARVMRMKDEQGTAVVEFAIVAPLLFLILFGIIEFGILLYDKAMITNASREGARAGIVFRPSRIIAEEDDEITDVVQAYCADHLISFGSGSGLTVSISRSGVEAGDNLTVSVDYPFQFLVVSNLVALIAGSAGNPIVLNAETVMRLE
jgi:Flp pilus assembly protein TadG